MSSRVVVDDGSENGVREIAHFDPLTGDLTGLERVMTVDNLLEANKRAYNEGLQNRQSEFRRVASYDPLTVEIFCKKWGVDQRTLFRKGNEQLVQRLLNDPDLRHFRTLPGRF